MAETSFIYVDSVLAILAFVTNILILIAVVNTKFGMAGFRKLVINLTVGDLYISIMNMASIIYQFYLSYLSYDEEMALDSNQNQSFTMVMVRCTANLIRTLKLVGFFANLLNLLGMSADHYFGIVYPLRYKVVVSNRSLNIFIVAIWILAFVVAFGDLPFNIANYYNTQVNAEDRADRQEKLGLSINRLSKELKELREQSQEMKWQSVTFLPDNPNNPLSPEIAIEKKQVKKFNFNQLFNFDFVFFIVRINETKSELIKLFALMLDEEMSPSTSNTCFLFPNAQSGKMWFEITIFILSFLCFIFLSCFYGFMLRDVSASAASSGPELRTKKLVVTTLMFLCAFFIWYVPFL